MLLYAIYTPAEVNSWHREQVWAFASVERFVKALREINGSDRAERLNAVIKEEAMKHSCFAILKGHEDHGYVLIDEEGVRDNWDGKWRRIDLAETIAGEQVPVQRDYA